MNRTTPAMIKALRACLPTGVRDIRSGTGCEVTVDGNTAQVKKAPFPKTVPLDFIPMGDGMFALEPSKPGKRF